jgi:hypothetical protein
VLGQIPDSTLLDRIAELNAADSVAERIRADARCCSPSV